MPLEPPIISIVWLDFQRVVMKLQRPWETTQDRPKRRLAARRPESAAENRPGSLTSRRRLLRLAAGRERVHLVAVEKHDVLLVRRAHVRPNIEA